MVIIKTTWSNQTVILTGNETQQDYDQYEMNKAANIIHISDEGIVTIQKVKFKELTRQANEKILKY